MKPDYITLAKPEAAAQLFLVFHGIGDSAEGLRPLGELFAREFPQAAVFCVNSPYPCDFSSGYQWYSIDQISDAERVARTQAALPLFVETVQYFQQLTGVEPAATALVGFSQGAFMALESTQYPLKTAPMHLAGRVVALAGRFAQPPELPHALTTVHFLHGKEDDVVPYGHTVAAAERLAALGADVTADVLAAVAHEITPVMAELMMHRLSSHVPKRMWQEALRAAQDGEAV